MPNLARYQRGFGRKKPSPWARIDGTHPLGKLCLMSVLVNEGGSRIYDSVKGRIFNFAGSPIALYRGGLTGLCWNNIAANSQGAKATAATSLGQSSASSLSIECLCYPTDLSTRMGLFGNTETANNVPRLEIGSLGTAAIAVTYPGTVIANSTTGVLSANNWYHIVYTRTVAKANAFYVNGVSVGTQSSDTSTAFIDTASTWELARYDNGEIWFQGLYEYLRVFDGALTAAQVMSLYTNPYEMYVAPAPRIAPIQSPPPSSVINSTFVIAPNYSMTIPGYLIAR